MIKKSTFSIADSKHFKEQMLEWCKRFNICSLFDSQQYEQQYQSFESMLAVGSVDSIALNLIDYSSLKQFIHKEKRWLIGHVSFGFHSIVDSPVKEDKIGFPLLHLYEPEIIVQLHAQEVIIYSHKETPYSIFDAINATQIVASITAASVTFSPTITKEQYLATIQQLQEHIHRGDCYEINFCQEFYAADTLIDSYAVYKRLCNISPTPFSSFYRFNDAYLICASPERFLKKQGDKIIAQPIKGTSARNKEDALLDNLNKEELLLDKKERAENVMIVDLMRNDLSKFCKEGTVKVEELFGIYSFPQVHQMISTIIGEVGSEFDFTDILQATFPMGSMTGAPKKRVLELINEYEISERGLYSGSVGYITPEGDFDFNVVIRSILYNAAKRSVSYQVGSGITFYSDAEKEYEECLIKAIGMQKALS